MNAIGSVEDAYQSLAQEIMEFVAERPWDTAKGIYQILTRSTGHKWLLVKDGVENKKGRAPSWNASDALFFLRDHILATTGDRIWGLTFTLFPDGKFNIEYDYNQPADFEEDEEEAKEPLPVNAALDSLRGMGVQLELDDPANQSPEAKLLSSALAWLQKQTSTHSATWGLGDEVSWNLDMNGGWLHWRFADGRALQADVQVIGTYNTQDRTFLWGWDHPSVPEPLRRAARKAHAMGTEHGFERLTMRSVACTEDEAWQFTALAAQLDEAVGAYRGDANGTWVYMSFAAPKAIGVQR